LLRITESLRPLYGIYMICSLKILNNVIKLPSGVKSPNVDFRHVFCDIGRQAVGIGRLAKLISPFKDVTFMSRSKNSRKKRTTSVVEYILKNNMMTSRKTVDLILRLMK